MQESDPRLSTGLQYPGGRLRRVNLRPQFGEYYIAYMVWREKVVILAVAHAKRRPYYWRSRVAEAKNLF